MNSGLVAFFDSLTTPESEDWQVIVDGKTAHVMAFHEDRTPMGKTLVELAKFELPVRDLKKSVRNPSAGGRPLGCVTVIICSDGVAAGTKLVAWLTHIAKTRNFSVLYLIGQSSTAEAIKEQQNYQAPADFISINTMKVGHA